MELPSLKLDVINGRSLRGHTLITLARFCLFLNDLLSYYFCLDYLCDALWEHLNMVRIYTKKPGCPPDFEDPIILKRGSDVKKVCFTLHRDLPDQFKYALVWVSFRVFIPILISYLLNITFLWVQIHVFILEVQLQ